MTKTNQPLLKTIWLWLIGIIVLSAVIGLLIFSFKQSAQAKKFEPINFLPPSTIYNLDLASADIKTAYGQLEQS